MVSVLFICNTGISLSPLLAAIFSDLVKQANLESKLEVDCAGSHPGKNPRPVERRVIDLATANNLQIPEKLSREITAHDLEHFSQVVCMNDSNFWFIKTLSADIVPQKVRLLLEYSGQLGLREMPDPLLGEVSYQEAFQILAKVAPQLLDELCRKFSLQR